MERLNGLLCLNFDPPSFYYEFNSLPSPLPNTFSLSRSLSLSYSLNLSLLLFTPPLFTPPFFFLLHTIYK